jgi:hypothetical protein
MKRNTDLSPSCAAEAVQDSAETSSRPSGCDAAIDRATVMLVRGMLKTEAPIANLSSALARMARTLSENGTPLFGEPVARRAADVQVFRDDFARDIAVCIESLQFHDRCMQELTEARDILTGLATNRFPAKLPTASANEGSVEMF